MCFLFSLRPSGETVVCNMAWMCVCVCVWDSSLLFLNRWWEKRRKGAWGGGIDPGIWSFWNESSKELPAAHINHPQLAQRGNSICRELRCILFIEELLVIRPYTPSHSKSQWTRQEAATCLFYKKSRTNPPPFSPLQGGKKCLNESPVSSCVLRWCPVCWAKQGDLR